MLYEKPPMEEVLMHYGTPRHSGRYPWGSGENPYQHTGNFMSRVTKLKNQGMSETDIAKALGMSTTQYRNMITIANEERSNYEYQKALDLLGQGYSKQKIAEMMGYSSESSIRSILSTGDKKAQSFKPTALTTAEVLKSMVDENGMLDVGKGAEEHLGISKEKLSAALTLLDQEGYPTMNSRIPQVTNPGKYTTLKVLCPPDTPYKINDNGDKVSSSVYQYSDIHSINKYKSDDGGETYNPKWVYPKSMDSKRLSICYGDEGGKDKDGLIEIRRGVDDLSLGNSHYAQVRILVDGTHYLKGMATYADDLPDGVDIRFNTNKKSGTPMKDVLKKIKDDPDNPFGSNLKEGISDPDESLVEDYKGGQSYYYDKNGTKQLSLINKTREEGDWTKWNNELSAQFLSKQSKKLIDQQLNLTIAEKQDEYNQICSLTNPTVKKVLLESYANDCDSAAVHLKAAALPRQRYQVILPLTSIKDTQIYAPNYTNGEKVALIRYPHGGTFEIPVLTVNNKGQEGRNLLGTNPIDAVGISSAVAEQLSGADFDGDTVMVIPCNSSKSNVNITSRPKLRELENFDTKSYEADLVTTDSDGTDHYYRNGKEFKTMSEAAKQNEMGKISNLITDMTLIGANDNDLASAVKHSMVVIDAVKHNLDYKQSYEDNHIELLKKRYQQHTDDDKYGGSATLISRAKSQTSIPKTQGSAKVNQVSKSWYDPSKPEGALIYTKSSDPTYDVAKINRKTADEPNATIRVGKNGTVYADVDGNENWVKIQGSTKSYSEGDRVSVTVETKERTQRSTQMADTDDAMTLVSTARTPTELAYANYANTMKSLATQARKEMVYTGNIKYNAEANKKYKTEVDHLKAQLSLALQNAPRERQAQILAYTTVSAKTQSNPTMSKEDKKKASQQALTSARNAVGATRHSIDISDREWEAIQAGAISESMLKQILRNTDIDKVRQLATPRQTNELSATQQNMIKALSSSGYSNDEIANRLGISTASVWKYLK